MNYIRYSLDAKTGSAIDYQIFPLKITKIKVAVPGRVLNFTNIH